MRASATLSIIGDGYMNESHDVDFASLMTNRLNVPAGEVIFLEGQLADCAYVILQGEVQIAVSDAKGNIVIINRLQTGDLFGELALLQDDGKRTATATSVEGCVLLVIDKAVFAQRLANGDPWLKFVISHLSRCVVMWTDRVRAV
jgi:CRP-like cAMP-binding protein